MKPIVLNNFHILQNIILSFVFQLLFNWVQCLFHNELYMYIYTYIFIIVGYRIIIKTIRRKCHREPAHDTKTDDILGINCCGSLVGWFEEYFERIMLSILNILLLLLLWLLSLIIIVIITIIIYNFIIIITIIIAIINNTLHNFYRVEKKKKKSETNIVIKQINKDIRGWDAPNKNERQLLVRPLFTFLYFNNK